MLASGRGWIVHTPAQEVLEIDCPEEDRPTVAAFLTEPERDFSDADIEVLAPLIDYLHEERALEVLEADDDLECAVWSDPDLDTNVLDVVLARHRVTRTTSPTAPLLAVAGWLPDAAWQTLDSAASVDGRSWVPVYAEGDTWYAGPLRSGTCAGTAGYRDLRVRRLAASPCSARLDELWASGAAPATQVRPLAPMVAALEHAIAALRTDAAIAGTGAAATPSSLALRCRQVAFGVDGRRSDHPVLPVPLHLLRAPSAPPTPAT